MEHISLNLTVDETNQVLEALGQMPYSKVFQLVEKIKNQAEAQVRAQGNVSNLPSSE